MIKRRRLMRGLGRACHVVSWMIVGAGLLAVYLAHTNPMFDHPLRDLRSSLLFDYWVFAALGAWLRPTRGSKAVSDTSPRWSGAGVIVATGVAGAGYFVSNASTASDYLVAAAILLATIVIALMIWRFATTYADEIGEARFVTTER